MIWCPTKIRMTYSKIGILYDITSFVKSEGNSFSTRKVTVSVQLKKPLLHKDQDNGEDPGRSKKYCHISTHITITCYPQGLTARRL